MTQRHRGWATAATVAVAILGSFTLVPTPPALSAVTCANGSIVTSPTVGTTPSRSTACIEDYASTVTFPVNAPLMRDLSGLSPQWRVDIQYSLCDPARGLVMVNGRTRCGLAYKSFQRSFYPSGATLPNAASRYASTLSAYRNTGTALNTVDCACSVPTFMWVEWFKPVRL